MTSLNPKKPILTELILYGDGASKSRQNALVLVEPVDSRKRRPPRRASGGVPRPQLTTALRPRKERHAKNRQQAAEE